MLSVDDDDNDDDDEGQQPPYMESGFRSVYCDT